MSVPSGLPPTEGPCLKCGKTVTSPDTTNGGKNDTETATDKNPRKSGGKLNPIVFWGLTICAILILGLVGMMLYSSDESLPKKQDDSTHTDPQKEEHSTQESWEKEAFTVLQSFLEAETAEERKKYIQGAEMFPAQLASGLNLDKLNVLGFVSHEVEEQDKARGIFSLSYRMPRAYGLTKMFPPVPTSKEKISPLNELSLNTRTRAMTDHLIDDEVMVSAFFKDGEEGMKLDWPVFAQSLYGILDSFMVSDQGRTQAIFRVGIFRDRVLPHLDSNEVLAVYRIGEASQIDESYRVMIYDEKIKQQLENRFTERGNSVEGATILIEKRNEEVILKEIICWEFLGLGGK